MTLGLTIIRQWCLLHLAEATEIQQKLRDEIQRARQSGRAEGREHLETEELSELPYLDAVFVRLYVLTSDFGYRT
jgi:Cytochrome P450